MAVFEGGAADGRRPDGWKKKKVRKPDTYAAVHFDSDQQAINDDCLILVSMLGGSVGAHATIERDRIVCRLTEQAEEMFKRRKIVFTPIDIGTIDPVAQYKMNLEGSKAAALDPTSLGQFLNPAIIDPVYAVVEAVVGKAKTDDPEGYRGIKNAWNVLNEFDMEDIRKLRTFCQRAAKPANKRVADHESGDLNV